MIRFGLVRFFFFIILLTNLYSSALAQPWTVNNPIVSVDREVYAVQATSGDHRAPGSKMFLAGTMDGANTHRMQMQYTNGGDIATDVTYRFSDDNGRTWSTPVAAPPTGLFIPTPQGGSMRLNESPSNMMPVFDPTSGLLIQGWQRTFTWQNTGSSVAHHYLHPYYRTSADHGVTWTKPIPLDYESGPLYTGTLFMDDPDLSNGVNVGNLFSSSYYTTNNGYPAQKFTINSAGKLVIGFGEVPVRKPGQDNDSSAGDTLPYRQGAMNMVGTWNAATQKYTWQSSNTVTFSTALSTRALSEPDTIALKDGRILTTYRGSNTGLTGTAAQNAAHKWLSIATDGGLTLGSVQELKYDDGTGFYSPSSYHRTFRAASNGKLYWIGNITETLPNGNGPRDELMIAEIDETLLIPALKKSTVTLIAEQLPGELSSVQYSNFSLLENPETGQIELCLTNLGKYGSGSQVINGFNVYDGEDLKFTLTFIPEPSTYALMLCGCIVVILRWRQQQRRVAAG